MDFGLLYENDQGEYVVLNDVRMADIPLASLVYLPCLPYHVLRAYCTFASKETSLHYSIWGPAQIITFARFLRKMMSYTRVAL